MAKAYCRVEWDLLRNMMSKLGFCVEWVSKAMNCLTETTFSVIINKKPRGMVTAERGLRHGCPLSPYLFLICAEGLSGMLNKVELDGGDTRFKSS